jgi:hypothetical protein
MRQVAMSTRPLATVEAICKDYPSVQHQVDIDERPDASDVQPLRVRVQRRQSRSLGFARSSGLRFDAS